MADAIGPANPSPVSTSPVSTDSKGNLRLTMTDKKGTEVKVAAYAANEKGKFSLATQLRITLGLATRVVVLEGKETKPIAININSLAKRLGIAKPQAKEMIKGARGNLKTLSYLAHAPNIDCALKEVQMQGFVEHKGSTFSTDITQEQYDKQVRDDCHFLSSEEASEHLEAAKKETQKEKPDECDDRSPKHPDHAITGNTPFLELMGEAIPTDYTTPAQVTVSYKSGETTKSVDMPIVCSKKAGTSTAQVKGKSGCEKEAEAKQLRELLQKKGSIDPNKEADLVSVRCENPKQVMIKIRGTPQEDTTLCETIKLRLKSGHTVDAKLTGVFDGHGGPGVSQHLAKNFQQVFQHYLDEDKTLSTTDDQRIINAFRYACLQLNHDCPGELEGSTANLQLSFSDPEQAENTLVYTANVGDSPSFVVSSSGEVTPTSVQHELTSERIALMQARGGIIEEDGRGRSCVLCKYESVVDTKGGYVQLLSEGNSIGDHGANGAPNPGPQVTKMSFPSGCVRVQCSDGVVPGVLSMNDVAAIIKKCRDAGISDPSKIAGRIAEVVARLGCDDNATVIVTMT